MQAIVTSALVFAGLRTVRRSRRGLRRRHRRGRPVRRHADERPVSSPWASRWRPRCPAGRLKAWPLQGQAVVDVSWALANKRRRHVRPLAAVRHDAPAVRQVGRRHGRPRRLRRRGARGHPGRLGLDAVFPTFFLGLVLAEVRDPQSRLIALVGAADRPGARADHTSRHTRARRRGRQRAGTSPVMGPVEKTRLLIAGLRGHHRAREGGRSRHSGRSCSLRPSSCFRLVASLAPALLAALVVTTASLADGQQLAGRRGDSRGGGGWSAPVVRKVRRASRLGGDARDSPAACPLLSGALVD